MNTIKRLGFLSLNKSVRFQLQSRWKKTLFYPVSPLHYVADVTRRLHLLLNYNFLWVTKFSVYQVIPECSSCNLISVQVNHELIMSWISFLPPPLLPSDAVHAAVQPAGKAAPTEMVRASVRQGEEEDLQGPGADHTGQETQDVQLLGVEGPQDCVQEVKE